MQLPKKGKLFSDNAENSVDTSKNLSTSKNIDFCVEESEKETRNPMSAEANFSPATKIIEIKVNEGDDLLVIPEMQSSLPKLSFSEELVEKEELVTSIDNSRAIVQNEVHSNVDISVNPDVLHEVTQSPVMQKKKQPAKPKKKRKRKRIPLNMPKSSARAQVRFIDCKYKFETYTKARAYKNSPANIALRKLPNLSQAIIMNSAKRKVNRQRKRSVVTKETPLSRSHCNRSLKRSFGNASGGSDVAKRLEMSADCDVGGGHNETGQSVCTNCSTNIVDVTQSPETPIEKLLCQQCVCALNQHNKTHLLANKTSNRFSDSPHRGSLKSRINRKRKKPTISKLVETKITKEIPSSSGVSEPELSRQPDTTLAVEESKQSLSSSTLSVESKSTSSIGRKSSKGAVKGKALAVSAPKPPVKSKVVETKNKKKKASPVKSSMERRKRRVSIGSITLLNMSSSGDGSSSSATGVTRRSLRQRKTVNYKLSRTVNRALKTLSSATMSTAAEEKDLEKNKKDIRKNNGQLSVVDEVNESQETSSVSASNKTSNNNKKQQRKRKTAAQPQTSKSSRRGATTKSTKTPQEPMLMETTEEDKTTTTTTTTTTRTMRKRKVAEKDVITNNEAPTSPNKQSRIISTRESAVSTSSITQKKAPAPVSSRKGSTSPVIRKNAPIPARKGTSRSSSSTATTTITRKKGSPTNVSSTKVNRKKSSTSEESDSEVVLNFPKGYEQFGKKKNDTDKDSGKENICSSQEDGEESSVETTGKITFCHILLSFDTTPLHHFFLTLTPLEFPESPTYFRYPPGNPPFFLNF